MNNNKLTKSLVKVVNGLSQTKTTNNNKKSNNKRRNRRNNTRRFQKFVNNRVPRGILAGYGSAITSSFYTRHSGDGCTVRGIDLVTSAYTFSNQDYHYISYFVTANPATWLGTRIAAVAQGFQNYRPIVFKIHYRPQTGSTSTYSMFIGTVWQNNYIRYPNSLEPSLVTSPGGTYLPAWQSSTSVVPLNKRLPQRMYPIRDPDMTTVPFSLVARASSGDANSNSVTMPGRIFIEYVYRFDNAIGFGATNTGSTEQGNSGFYPGKVEWRTIANAQTDYTAGWIIDKSLAPTVSTHGSLPFFARLSWDRGYDGTNSVYYPEINGRDFPTVNTYEVAIYNDDGGPA